MGDFVVEKGMLEDKIAIFLTIEALIFDFPAQASGLIGEGGDIAFQQSEVCDPFELGGQQTTLGLRDAFNPFHDIEGMMLVFAIAVVDGIDPTKSLLPAGREGNRQMTVRG